MSHNISHILWKHEARLVLYSPDKMCYNISHILRKYEACLVFYKILLCYNISHILRKHEARLVLYSPDKMCYKISHILRKHEARLVLYKMCYNISHILHPTLSLFGLLQNVLSAKHNKPAALQCVHLDYDMFHQIVAWNGNKCPALVARK